jgi:hypothetical protein
MVSKFVVERDLLKKNKNAWFLINVMLNDEIKKKFILTQVKISYPWPGHETEIITLKKLMNLNSK